MIAAVALNVILFFQTAISQLGPGDISGTLVTLMGSIFPSGGIREPSASPLPSPSRAIVTTGGS